MRSHFNIPPGIKIRTIASAKHAETLAPLKRNPEYVTQLAKIEGFETGIDLSKPALSATAVFKDLSFYVPLEGLIDFKCERERLVKELEKLGKEVEICSGRLSNPVFTQKAPPAEVKSIELRLAEA
ncbi:MAG: hypothetical protein WCS77_11040, partial [Elusimicrobiaceae bacterium]